MFQSSSEIASVIRNGSWVTMIVKISAGSSGPRRRQTSRRSRLGLFRAPYDGSVASVASLVVAVIWSSAGCDCSIWDLGQASGLVAGLLG